jgi:hypothetical protein
LEIEALDDRVVPATITVTRMADTGPGTLRAAIERANLDRANDTITFAFGGGMGGIALETALPELSTNMTIASSDESLSVFRATPDSAQFRIFTGATGVEVSISGLSIAAADAFETSGGCIENSGTLTLTRCSVDAGSALSRAAASKTRAR